MTGRLSEETAEHK